MEGESRDPTFDFADPTGGDAGDSQGFHLNHRCDYAMHMVVEAMELTAYDLHCIESKFYDLSMIYIR